VNNRSDKLKNLLEGLYAKYSRTEFIKSDPLWFVYRYSTPADMEIAGLLAAVLAYGRVSQIKKSLTSLFGCMGNNPSEFVDSFNGHNRKKLKDFRHRFTTGDNISDLLELLKIVYKKCGSLENYFLTGYSPDDRNTLGGLANFCSGLLGLYVKTHNSQPARGLKYLLAGPDGGSACKRLNLFLRWMIRDKDVDTGLWKSVDKAKLIMPVDVHISRLYRNLGFFNSRAVTLAAAIKITKRFAEIEPSDPVKYDFALSRVGILQKYASINYSTTPHL